MGVGGDDEVAVEATYCTEECLRVEMDAMDGYGITRAGEQRDFAESTGACWNASDGAAACFDDTAKMRQDGNGGLDGASLKEEATAASRWGISSRDRVAQAYLESVVLHLCVCRGA